jgi:hypothetical protein
MIRALDALDALDTLDTPEALLGTMTEVVDALPGVV